MHIYGISTRLPYKNVQEQCRHENISVGIPGTPQNCPVFYAAYQHTPYYVYYKWTRRLGRASRGGRGGFDIFTTRESRPRKHAQRLLSAVTAAFTSAEIAQL